MHHVIYNVAALFPNRSFSPPRFTGLRGMRNLGSTCFMNVILQCFIHNPPLRSYFLSDKHNARACPNDRATCLACQTDNLFSQVSSGCACVCVCVLSLYVGMYYVLHAVSPYIIFDAQFYSGEITPFAPYEFLWAMWMSCSQLIGYAQQDAHEFFIGAVNGMHNSLEAADPSLTDHDPSKCGCIVHRIFCGRLERRTF